METRVRGRTIKVDIDDKGVFSAELNGEKFQNKTLEGLKGVINRRLASKPLSIRVIDASEGYYNKPTYRRGTIIGKHSSNGNLLIKWDGKDRAEQEGRYGSGLLKETADIEELKRLRKAAKDADAAVEKFIEENSFDRSTLPE
jgi:hypothetical protein